MDVLHTGVRTVALPHISTISLSGRLEITCSLTERNFSIPPMERIATVNLSSATRHALSELIAAKCYLMDLHLVGTTWMYVRIEEPF